MKGLGRELCLRCGNAQQDHNYLILMGLPTCTVRAAVAVAIAAQHAQAPWTRNLGPHVGEQERSILRKHSTRRPEAGPPAGDKLGRPKVAPKVENAIRTHLSAGMGILKVAALVGVRSGTVLRVKREMAVQLAEAA
jgi:hypothetical protein